MYITGIIFPSLILIFFYLYTLKHNSSHSQPSKVNIGLCLFVSKSYIQILLISIYRLSPPRAVQKAQLVYYGGEVYTILYRGYINISIFATKVSIYCGALPFLSSLTCHESRLNPIVGDFYCWKRTEFNNLFFCTLDLGLS